MTASTTFDGSTIHQRTLKTSSKRPASSQVSAIGGARIRVPASTSGPRQASGFTAAKLPRAVTAARGTSSPALLAPARRRASGATGVANFARSAARGGPSVFAASPYLE